MIQQGDEDSSVSVQQRDDTGGEDGGVEAQQEGGNCDPNYEGRCLDEPGDYDCEITGDRRGDGPNYVTGPFRRVGDDPHDLDRDRDGIACEDTDDGGSTSGDQSGDDHPRGGVDAGFGGIAPRPAAATGGGGVCKPLAAGGGFLMLLGAGGLLVTLRRRV